MTVSSLWKALDRAECGQPIGIKELVDHHQLHKKTNPWNYNEMNRERLQPNNRPVLAVDLSIWICEGLTSSSMKQNYSVVDPPIQLVYSRTLRLLNLGIKLVVVIEGKRRIRRAVSVEDQGIENNNNNVFVGGEDKFRKRRSGAPFWTACQRCEEMLQYMGVPVVRATAEGEALCALLNQKGIVDGVISNDGDCFLFGAKTMYTKFSIENLEQSKVMRYDIDSIRAFVDDDDSDKYDETRQTTKYGENIIKLTRDDLIAFAILTGSDLAGDGLSKVGCRKAIRFIRKCQIDNPLKLNDSPALKELISWGKLSGATKCTNRNGADKLEDTTGTACGCCGHAGNKRSHKKDGCRECGTEPGEPCFQLSPGGKFRKSLRAKAIEMGPRFEPSSTIEAYRRPNNNQLPIQFVGKTARTLEMNQPDLPAFLRSPLFVRGGTLYDSREYVQKSLSAYLARTELFNRMTASKKDEKVVKLPKNQNTPVPIRISKMLVRAGTPSCEVQWLIKASMTDAEGNPIDQFEFATIEDENMIRKCYPSLLETFKEEQIKLQEQGDTEKEKRQAFLESMFAEYDKENLVEEGVGLGGKGKKENRMRQEFFGNCLVEKQGKKVFKAVGDDVNALFNDIKKLALPQPKSQKKNVKQERDDTKRLYGNDGKQDVGLYDSLGDDMMRILGNAPGIDHLRDETSTIQSASLMSQESTAVFRSNNGVLDETYVNDTLTPSHVYFLKKPNELEGEKKNHNAKLVDVPPRHHKLGTKNDMEKSSPLTKELQQERSFYRQGNMTPTARLNRFDEAIIDSITYQDNFLQKGCIVQPDKLKMPSWLQGEPNRFRLCNNTRSRHSYEEQHTNFQEDWTFETSEFQERIHERAFCALGSVLSVQDACEYSYELESCRERSSLERCSKSNRNIEAFASDLAFEMYDATGQRKNKCRNFHKQEHAAFEVVDACHDECDKHNHVYGSSGVDDHCERRHRQQKDDHNYKDHKFDKSSRDRKEQLYQKLVDLPDEVIDASLEVLLQAHAQRNGRRIKPETETLPRPTHSREIAGHQSEEAYLSFAWANQIVNQRNEKDFHHDYDGFDSDPVCVIQSKSRKRKRSVDKHQHNFRECSTRPSSKKCHSVMHRHSFPFGHMDDYLNDQICMQDDWEIQRESTADKTHLGGESWNIDAAYKKKCKQSKSNRPKDGLKDTELEERVARKFAKAKQAARINEMIRGDCDGLYCENDNWFVCN